MSGKQRQKSAGETTAALSRNLARCCRPATDQAVDSARAEIQQLC
jgi:hypothetical protein